MSPPVVLIVNCLDAAVVVSTPDTCSPHPPNVSSPHPPNVSSAHPLSLVELIPNVTETETSNSVSNQRVLRWSIDNKYYDADVDLVAIPSPLLPGVSNPVVDNEVDLADRVEALILCFGGGEDDESNGTRIDKNCSSSSFNLVKHWTPFVERFAPPVRLLVCPGFDDDDKKRAGWTDQTEILGWCIDNQFELVQMAGEEEEEEEEDELDSRADRKEPFSSGEFGLGRILAALHAHTWSNLKMKSAPKSSGLAAASGGGHFGAEQEANEVISNDASENDPEPTTKATVEDDKLKSIFDGINLAGNDGGDDHDDDDEESFDQLFHRMAQLKSQSQNMAFEDRKVFAEQVTMAFWRAIGGDEDELEGLEDAL